MPNRTFKRLLYEVLDHDPTHDDYSPHSIRGMIFDLRKFSRYFVAVNQEPFDSSRVTVMDLTGFKQDLREKRRQSVSTINRALVTLRQYFQWLVDQKILQTNIVKQVNCIDNG